MGAILTLFFMLMAGCDNDETLIKEQQNQLKELEDQISEFENILQEQQKIIDDQSKEFSYLSDFTKEELEAYEQFAQYKDSQYLLGLSPEKILLIYYHSVVIDDIEAIYSLTYDNGTLPTYLLLDRSIIKKV
jgi:septal ring factor EnvC (AmiA/AmiB activator)